MGTPRRRVVLAEFIFFDQYPLVSGYLQSYARTAPEVAETFEFSCYQQDVTKIDYARTLAELNALDASIYCFSAYVWNMGLVVRLARDLQLNPRVERVILGGPQITHHIDQYFSPEDHKVVVVNGQGEIPFREALRRLARSEELHGLAGLSLYADRTLWNGGEAEIIKNLDDIPSPYLNGSFDRTSRAIAIFETNRGCPYECSFCTWGGETYTVAKFSLDRIKEELLWIAKKKTMMLWIADANWGMFPRDVELSGYIAKLKRDHRFPWIVDFSSAKNTPQRSLKCMVDFNGVGILTSQPLGIQSLNPVTLKRIKRENIKNSAYVEIFQELGRQGIDSNCELIWPLPGETLATLKDGFEQLLTLGAKTLILYPAILINNAHLSDQIAEEQMEAVSSADWVSDLKLVKKTRDASRTDTDDGFWFYYAFFLLANSDPHKALLRCLRATTGKKYSLIVSEFVDFLRASPDASRYRRLISTLFAEEAHGTVVTIGKLAVEITHEGRFAAQMDVARFILSRQLTDDPARGLILAGLWALSLPRTFSGSDDDPAAISNALDELGAPYGRRFSDLASLRRDGASVVLELHAEFDLWREVAAFFDGGGSAERPRAFEISHPGGRFPFTLDRHRNEIHAHGMILRLGKLASVLTVRSTSANDAVRSGEM